MKNSTARDRDIAAQGRYAKGWTRCDVCCEPAVGGNLLGAWCEEHEPSEDGRGSSAAPVGRWLFDRMIGVWCWWKYGR